jgi:hypothetical protein
MGSLMRLVTVGVGAMNSPRYAPAGLLVACRGTRVMLDGGPGADPTGAVDAWLVTDEHYELIAGIRRLARARGLEPRAQDFVTRSLAVHCHAVVHTSHSTFGYELIDLDTDARVVWAPEFLEFPRWAARADLMFAEAAAWKHPIRFTGGSGGHLDVCHVAEQARYHGIRRLVFAHIGRPTIRALDRGEPPSFGEFAHDGQVFVVTRHGRLPAQP